VTGIKRKGCVWRAKVTQLPSGGRNGTYGDFEGDLPKINKIMTAYHILKKKRISEHKSYISCLNNSEKHRTAQIISFHISQ
jgi:hypothetical protein